MNHASRTESCADLCRREFLRRAAQAGVLTPFLALERRSVLAGERPWGASPSTLRTEIPHGSVESLAKLIQSRKVSSTELVAACLRRVEQANPRLNAVVLLSPERALREAKDADNALSRKNVKGPLHGVPMTISDSFDTAGMISTGGTLGRKRYIASRDATVVARLRKAGAIVLGKTNVGELSLMDQTDNLVYGRTFNPYDVTCIPGGSAGGAAAIVASGASPFDMAGDWVGGLRLAAHFCGVMAIKPTQGLVPRTGHIIDYGGICDPCNQIGLVARWVDDLALLLSVIAGQDFRDAAIVPFPIRRPEETDLKTLRLVYYAKNADESAADAETSAILRSAVESLASTVLSVKEDCPRDLMKEAEEIRARFEGADDRAWVKRLLGKHGTTNTHPGLLLTGKLVTSAEFTELAERLDSCRSRLLQWFSNYDVILCPVDAQPARPYRDESGSPPQYPRDYGYTGIFNLTGWPAAVVRAGTSSGGLPIGLQVVGRPWREDVVLAVSRFLESRMGGWKPQAENKP
jgi:amidase